MFIMGSSVPGTDALVLWCSRRAGVEVLVLAGVSSRCCPVVDPYTLLKGL